MNRAVAYLRVSSPGQVEGEGLDRQQSACDSYTFAHGLTLSGVYREEGVCGANDLDERPALQRLLVDCLEQGITIVLIEKLDRIARDLMIQEQFLKDFRKRGLTLISTMEPDLCSSDPTRTLLRQIMGAVAEYDRKMTVFRLADARRKIKARDGKCEGAKAFGKLPGEAKALERMIELSRLGTSFVNIAAVLDCEGFRSRSNKWYPMTVSRILARHKNTPEVSRNGA